MSGAPPALPALPALPPRLVGVLATIGADGPHAIPVSALRRAGPRTVLLALAPGRGSLARLRAEPAAALTLIGPGFALTAHGRATVVADPLPGAEPMVAVALAVERVADHLRPETEIRAGVDWAWREEGGRGDEGPAARDARVMAALGRLTHGDPGS